jgi:hypothetical protein
MTSFLDAVDDEPAFATFNQRWYFMVVGRVAKGTFRKEAITRGPGVTIGMPVFMASISDKV